MGNNKKMDELGSVTSVDDADYMLVYDVTASGSEQSKNILYSDFETQMLAAVPEAPEADTLYYSSAAAVKSDSEGMSIIDPGGVEPTLYMKNQSEVTLGRFQSVAAYMRLDIYYDSAWQNVLHANTLGGVELYYNDLFVFTTTGAGIDVRDGSANTPTILLKNSGGTTFGRISANTTTFNLKVGSGLEDVFQGTLNGAATLYYDNVAKIATASTGVSVTGNISTTTDSDIGIDNSAGANEIVAADHGTADVDQVVNVCYGTGSPPTVTTTTIGTLFIKYIA